MKNIDEIHQTLTERVSYYEKKLIAKFIPADPAVGPEEYELDVKAFCILSHAALEDFFERVALAVASSAEQAWIRHKRATDTAIMMISKYGAPYDLRTNESSTDDKSVYDHIRNMLSEAKRNFSNDVHQNHGMSPKYLRALLVPIGLDFQPEPNICNSISKLAKERGDYVHKGLTRFVMAPEDARRYVEDCITFADLIRSKAVLKLE